MQLSLMGKLIILVLSIILFLIIMSSMDILGPIKAVF